MGFINKVNFSNMNFLSSEIKLGPNEYPLLINGRVRYNQVKPVKKPKLISGNLPDGNYQSISSVGDVLFVFIDGSCYYTTYPNTEWSFLAGFSLDSSVSQVFTEGVPVSTTNFARHLKDATDKTGGIQLRDKISSSLRGIVCQDGINQPQFITPDVSTATLGTYDNWSLSNREYVPIGRQMAFVNGILYIVAPDKQSIYRSVTGRPLDYMVNIDVNGDKEPLETDGGADSVSHSVDFNDITTISPLKSKGGEFFVGTLRSSYIVAPDLSSTIFGEPTYINDPTAETGPVNHYSLTAATDGDMVFIDSYGVRSIKAILSLEQDGVNSPFSSAVSRLFEDITQQTTACINFDNYIYFAVDTIYGPAVLVYDTLTRMFVAVDQYEGLASIKQFIQVEYSNNRVLVFITTDGELYEAFGSTEFETAKFLVSNASTLDASKYNTLQKAYISFSNIKTGGEVLVEHYANKAFVSSNVQSLSNIGLPTVIPSDFPYDVPFQETSECLTFQFSGDKRTAWENGILISWNANATLDTVLLETDEQPRSTTNHLSTVVTTSRELKIALTADGGVLTESLEEVVSLISAQNPDYVFNIGDTIYSPNTFSTIVSNGPWKEFFDQGKYFDALGNHELDSPSDYLNAYTRGNNGRYYTKNISNIVEFFIGNSGLNTAGTLIEADGNTVDSAQNKWFDLQEAASTASWKFFAFHHPPYSSSSVYADYTDLRWDFRNYDAVLSGHVHFYERAIIANKNYITVGAGGNLYRSGYDSPVLNGSILRYGADYSYVLLTISDKVARFTTYSLSGDIVDEFILRK